jgi:hypothetical protein
MEETGKPVSFVFTSERLSIETTEFQAGDEMIFNRTVKWSLTARSNGL